jgi:hypothetical protein
MLSVQSLCVPLQADISSNIGLFVVLALTIIVFAGFWKTFEKAGEPGWAAIIPIYNLYVLVKISGNAGWWTILFFIPVLNFLATLKISINLAGKFDRGILFGLGLAILSFIFFPILGFGNYQYQDATRRTNSTVS